MKRDGRTCAYCGIETKPKNKAKNGLEYTTMDHVIPLSKGGDHTMENVVIACNSCNARKSDKTEYLVGVDKVAQDSIS